MKKIMNLFLVLCIMCSFIFLFGLKNINAYDTTTGNDEQAQKILNTFYHEGVYKKETSINLADASKAEVVKMFHASCNHLERITYYNNEEIWMTNEAGTINSGYETVDGDMKHFKKVDGVNVYDYTVENTITTEFYQTLKNLRNTSGWQLKNGAYVNDHETVIDQFRQFVAPLWLATDDAKNYIILTEVKMYEVGEQLFIDLYTSSTDGGKLTNNDGLFARAIISIERPVKEMNVISTDIHGNNFFGITTSQPISKDSNVDLYLIDSNNNKYTAIFRRHTGSYPIYEIMDYSNITTSEFNFYLTYYAEDAIYVTSGYVKNAAFITLDQYKTSNIQVAQQMPTSLGLTENLYDENGWSQIQLFVSAAIESINASDSFAKVDEILFELENDLKSVEFKKFDASELIAIYHEKIENELEKVIKDEYSEDNYSLIAKKADECKEQIVQLSTEEEMIIIVESFTTYVNTIKKEPIILSTDGSNFNPHGYSYIIMGWKATQLSIMNSSAVSEFAATLVTDDDETYIAEFICFDGAAAVKLYIPSYLDDVENGGYTVMVSFVYEGKPYVATRSVESKVVDVPTEPEEPDTPVVPGDSQPIAIDANKTKVEGAGIHIYLADKPNLAIEDFTITVISFESTQFAGYKDQLMGATSQVHYIQGDGWLFSTVIAGFPNGGDQVMVVNVTYELDGVTYSQNLKFVGNAYVAE